MTQKRTISRIGNKWTIPRYKREWRSICALLPAYLHDGTNGTMVTYLDGSDEAVGYRIPWVLDDLLGYLRTSRAVLTRQSKAYLGKQARRVPLIASEEFSLVPVKGRDELAKGDGTVGYIVMEHVADVIPRGAVNTVYFQGGAGITVLDTTRTLWGNLNLTKDMKEEILWQSTQSHCPVA